MRAVRCPKCPPKAITCGRNGGPGRPLGPPWPVDKARGRQSASLATLVGHERIAELRSGDWTPRRPFTRAEALYAGGLTDRDLSIGDRFVRLFQQRLCRPADDPALAVMRAEGGPSDRAADGVASHHTAAVIWGGAVPRAVGDPPDRPGRARLPGGRASTPIATCPSTGRWFIAGCGSTSPERTVCDLARQLDLRRARHPRRPPGATRCDESRTTGPGGGRLAPAPGRRLLRRGHAPGAAAASTRLRSHAFGSSSSWPGFRSPPSTTSSVNRTPVSGCGRFELAYLELLLAIEYQGRWHRRVRGGLGVGHRRREELDSPDLADHRGHRRRPRRRPATGLASDRAGPPRARSAASRRASPRSGGRSSRASPLTPITPHVMTCGTDSPKCPPKGHHVVVSPTVQDVRNVGERLTTWAGAGG